MDRPRGFLQQDIFGVVCVVEHPDIGGQAEERRVIGCAERREAIDLRLIVRGGIAAGQTREQLVLQERIAIEVVVIPVLRTLQQRIGREDREELLHARRRGALRAVRLAGGGQVGEQVKNGAAVPGLAAGVAVVGQIRRLHDGAAAQQDSKKQRKGKQAFFHGRPPPPIYSPVLLC